jgi:hypothetical protein
VLGLDMQIRKGEGRYERMGVIWMKVSGRTILA